MLSQHLKNTSEVIHMLSLYLVFHYHVINVDFIVLVELGFKHSSYYPLVSRPSTLQSKWHHLVMIIPCGHYKSSLLLVSQS